MPMTPESEMKNSESQQTSVAAQSETMPPTEPIDEARLRRISEYRQAAAKDPDVLQSLVASANSGLFQIGFLLERNLTQGLQDLSERGASLDTLFPTIDILLKVSRQSDRYIQITRPVNRKREPPVTETPA